MYFDKDRNACTERLLKISSNACLKLRTRMITNISRMKNTQSIMEKINHNTSQNIWEEKVKTDKIMKVRTLRIVQAMLRYTYRPHGRMYTKTMQKIL